MRYADPIDSNAYAVGKAYYKATKPPRAKTR